MIEISICVLVENIAILFLYLKIISLEYQIGSLIRELGSQNFDIRRCGKAIEECREKLKEQEHERD